MRHEVVEDFKNAGGLWVKSFGAAPDSLVRTISGVKWKAMLSRCKVEGYYQKNKPTYVGCSVSDVMSNFQTFTNWHVEQVGYGLIGYHLEKDILVSDNKVYSEDTCVLVPGDLNQFLCANDSVRGKWPQGVCFHKRVSKFSVGISINGRRKHLGYYSTPCAAATVYKSAKEAEAYRWYERLRDGEFIVDKRVIERMRTWEHICDWKEQ